MDLKESTSEKKKARRDYTLEWEARAGDPRNLDEAHYRVHIEVAGDRVSALRSYWKIPETYERSRDRQNALSIVVMALRIGMIAAGMVYALWLLIQATRKGLVRWGGAIRLAVPATLLFALAWLLSFELMMKGYNTAIPLETYQAVLYMTLLMSVIFMFLMLGAAAALIALFYPESVGALRAANRGLLGLDAGAALLAAAGLAILLNQHDAMLMDHYHAQALFAIGSPDLIVSRAPALAAVVRYLALRFFAIHGFSIRRLRSYSLMHFLHLPLKPSRVHKSLPNADLGRSEQHEGQFFVPSSFTPNRMLCSLLRAFRFM